MNGPVWEGVFASFRDVPVTGPGFCGEIWKDNSLKKIRRLREAAASKNTVSSVPVNRDSLLPLLAALVHAAQRQVRILDFGGGVGFSYYQILRGLPEKAAFELHIVDIKEVCHTGREFFAGVSNISFHESLPDLQPFDIVHLGSSLHYIEDWKAVLQSLCAYGADFFLLCDLPAGDIPTFASGQNYYGSRMPVWFFNVAAVCEAMADNAYELLYRSAYVATIRGTEGEVPQDNFDAQHRLGNACNLLFKREVFR